MRIAYIADADSIHCHKWITIFAEHHDVILICNKNQTHQKLYSSFSNIKIYPVLPNAYPLRKFWVRNRILSHLQKIIEQNDIQIIHSMYAVPNAFWAYQLNFKNHIVTTRGSDILIDYNKTFQSPKNLNEKITCYFLKRLVEKSLNKAIYITSTSQKQQEVIKKFIHDERKLIIARTGVDVNKFIKEFELLSRQTDDIVILSNRILRPMYNIHIIVDAFKLLKDKHPSKKIKLVIMKFYASADYLKEIIQQINENGLQKDVMFEESKEGKDLIQFYKNADMVIMIPSSDGTPVSAIEAMLAKKPLVMGNFDYDEDLFNKDTVWKVSSLSPVDICEKITEILNSTEEKKIKIECAFNLAMNMASLRKEAAKIEDLYKNMVIRGVTNQMVITKANGNF